MKISRLILCLSLLNVSVLLAELRLAAPIADHAVFQQGKPTSVWGSANPEAPVTVSFAGQTVDTTANAEGDWEVHLQPLTTNAESQDLTVSSGEELLTVTDVLVGEVWMCSGQSNMAWSLAKAQNAAEEIAAAEAPNIRLFSTTRETAVEPKRDCIGEWALCSPKTARDFSAVGYFFGRELAEHLGPNTPIGLINTAWGGKPSESFTSRAKLETVPAAKSLLAEWDRLASEFDPSKNPKADPRLNSNFPGAISNQMIEPWTRFAIAGAIWYQGESNQHRAKQYRDLFPATIEDWRARWDDSFPFYFVQLANFRVPSEEPGTPSVWAELQEAQTLTLKRLPDTGMAIINDIGEANNIHPKNKKDVGKRLARWALARDYGAEVSPVSGPIYARHEVEGAGVRVHFDHVGEGLKSRDGAALKRFEIASADEKFVWADAEISEDGKSVYVSSPDVAEPASVRYAWAANPQGANLVNSADLPASLFRTDDWEMATAGIETFEQSQDARRLVNLDKTHEQLQKRGWTILFNGKDVDGWMNPYDRGEVEVVNGEIRLKANKKFFLCTKEKFGDFMFMGEVRLPEGKANSGFMFRCHVEPNKVYGYQAEVDGSDRRWSGGLYDEGRRGWVWPSKKGRTKEENFLAHEESSQAHFAKPEVAGALKRNDWNRYQITCRGDRIVIKVNGVVTTQIQDDTDAEGHIAIQHHGEDGQIYRFRNLYLKKF